MTFNKELNQVMNPTHTTAVRTGQFRYQAFISYSQAADGRLAPALQAGLQRLARPWYRLRAMRVFRDETGLAVTPELWGSIEKALADANYFILLASPSAAQSRWVGQEVDWWLDHRPASRLLIVWTDGELVWDNVRSDFDWAQTNALPRRLEGAFPQQPLYLDLRWARTDTDLSLRRPRFADAIACVAATVRGLSLDEMIGEDVKQHRQTMGFLRLAMAILLVLTTASVLTAFLALKAKRMVDPLARNEQARTALQASEARSRQLAAMALNQQASDKDLAILLAAEAVRMHQTAEAESALRQMLAGPLQPGMILRGQPKSGYGAVFSPDGAKVLAWSQDGNPQLYDAATGKVLQALTGHASAAGYACFSPNGRLIATTSQEGLVRIWETGSEKPPLKLPHDEWVSAALFSSDGSRVLTLAVGRDAMLWNAVSGAKIAEVEYSSNLLFGDQVRDAAFHPDSSRIALCSGHWPVVLDAKTGKLVMNLEGHKQEVRSIAYSPDGQWLVTASGDRTVRRWRAATGLTQRVFTHDAELNEVRFSSDGKWIVARDSENLLLVWEAETGRKMAQIEILPKPTLLALFMLSPNGKCLLAADANSDTAGLWETGTGLRLGELVGEEGVIRTLHFSPDGKRAIVGSIAAPARIYQSEICASVHDLLALADRRVPRPLTSEERKQYLITP